jgi:hypothetical protein
MMIVSKHTEAVNDGNPFHRSALRRQDMRRGRQVVLYDIEKDTAMNATIMSSPFTTGPKMPDRENGSTILLRDNDLGSTGTYSLFLLGVEPSSQGEWCSSQYLLDANRYNNQQLREDGSDPLDPPER